MPSPTLKVGQYELNEEQQHEFIRMVGLYPAERFIGPWVNNIPTEEEIKEWVARCVVLDKDPWKYTEAYFRSNFLPPVDQRAYVTTHLRDTEEHGLHYLSIFQPDEALFASGIVSVLEDELKNVTLYCKECDMHKEDMETPCWHIQAIAYRDTKLFTEPNNLKRKRDEGSIDQHDPSWLPSELQVLVGLFTDHGNQFTKMLEDPRMVLLKECHRDANKLKCKIKYLQRKWAEDLVTSPPRPHGRRARISHGDDVVVISDEEDEPPARFQGARRVGRPAY